MRASPRICLALLVMLSACTTPEQNTPLKFELARQTAGPATLASFAELCGAPSDKIDSYMEAYIAFAGKKEPITAEEEEKMRKIFTDGRSGIYTRFPTPESITQQCTRYPPNHAVLDRGIAGDFSGQI